MANSKISKTKKKIVRKPMPAKKPPQKAKKSAVKKVPAKKQKKLTTKKAGPVKVAKPAIPIFSAPAMDKKELGFYRDKLAALKDEILNQIKEISEDTLMQSQKDVTGETSGYTMHMADVASDNYEREFNFRVVSGDRELLLEIESAIKKIESGDYGVCVMCDKTIGKSRLNVIPYAKYCRKCKEQLEKDGKL